jgi:small subunit ribosomal protein S1
LRSIATDIHGHSAQVLKNSSDLIFELRELRAELQGIALRRSNEIAELALKLRELRTELRWIPPGGERGVDTDEVDARAQLTSLRPGDEIDGTVARLETFGAFITLGPGIDGLVHVSEIRRGHTSDARDALCEGQKVRVKVLRVEGTDAHPRVALSIKAAMPDPWRGVAERYRVGRRVQGTVTRLADFGAFITLEPGIDGLVHVSEISHEPISHPRDALSEGQKVNAVVMAVDPAKKRIFLSIREALATRAEAAGEEQPWSLAPPRRRRRERAGAGADEPRVKPPSDTLRKEERQT